MRKHSEQTAYMGVFVCCACFVFWANKSGYLLKREKTMNEFGVKKVIAAVRTEEEFCAALDSSATHIFLLCSNIMTIKRQLDRAHNLGKKLFIHIDMSDGIGRDNAGVAYLASLGVDGIISTRTGIIRAAREYAVPTVQRIFSIDSQATQTSANAAGNFHPTYIEIMPGVIPKVISRFCKSTDIPIIAGGLVETAEEVSAALAAGAVAVSTGNKNLW